MMKKNEPNTVELETKCPCGESLAFKVKKPAHFKPALTKVGCPGCQSIFLVKACLKAGQKVDVDIGVQELSPKCREILQKVIDEREEATESNVTRGTFKSVEPPDGPKAS